MTSLALLTLALLTLRSVSSLSLWYTEPGSSSPAGSVAGDKVRGVNLGGWFILENWMMPSFFGVAPLDQYNILDEWHYCSILGKDECASRLTDHWATYVTEDDFMRFANYSLNTVRIPVGYWMWIDLEDYEPYVQGQLPYLEKALGWADKYGLDVMIDMHGLPGGQNGQDNQGVKGPIEFAYNQTNSDRALSAVQNMTQWVTQDKFNGIVKAIELANEPYIQEYNPGGMLFEDLANYYVQSYQVVRNSEHIIDGGHEVMVFIHDAFQPLANWDYFFSTEGLGLSWTNYGVDTHIYDAFGSSPDKTWQEHLDTMCYLASSIASAQTKFPVIVGEFSLGTNTYCVDYQSCFGATLADTIANLTDYETSLFLRQFWEVQSDVYELGAGWIFWSHANEFAAPWSWSQSAAQNWIPEDPTEKIWPFYSDASSGCLDISNPIAGDQNLPYFPGYANNISNINIDFVRAKYASASSASSTNDNSTSASISSSSGTSSVTSPSSGSSPSASASASSSASGARRRIRGEATEVLGMLLLVVGIMF
ncbi:hypothetical protein TREMEDRAFT_43106 [Tremella mesenterica DSM 1558]|uniref:uncharacterized protein n=1 Tax=Tremella mesenterica (strain ATCC 24925 / CBS 8224 / DSM 1558 / NBRC 9311 / NRRL Y-6157 / RJB 2259-6 / UBC 559-6) TaxID=578456 RepID=UPI0003F4A4F5|nr:uncharacterized protein TREMEDRAFT_43106 [Tremella mesenterica DSM 1558]EIW70375.1 hypothetical protein TREMEDRAFT_43106 [Tremella mesenterica DSM 1558]